MNQNLSGLALIGIMCAFASILLIIGPGSTGAAASCSASDFLIIQGGGQVSVHCLDPQLTGGEGKFHKKPEGVSRRYAIAQRDWDYDEVRVAQSPPRYNNNDVRTLPPR